MSASNAFYKHKETNDIYSVLRVSTSKLNGTWQVITVWKNHSQDLVVSLLGYAFEMELIKIELTN